MSRWPGGPAAEHDRTGRPGTRAVGPVVGVLLLIAMTIMLATIVGTFATGLWDEEHEPVPQVQFGYEYDDATGELTITHRGGDTFERANVRYVIVGEGTVPASDVTDDWPTEVTASASVTISTVDADDELRVVWHEPKTQGKTEVITTWSGPDT